MECNTRRKDWGDFKEEMEKQRMHGQYIRNMDRLLIGEEDTFLWLSKGDLKAETESEIVAAQDRALHTKRCATKYCTQRRTVNADCANSLMRQ
jgi:hypothetical protein